MSIVKLFKNIFSTKKNTNETKIIEVKKDFDEELSSLNEESTIIKDIKKIDTKQIKYNAYNLNAEAYLKKFENAKNYDMNKVLDEKFIKGIKLSKEVEYEKFIKYGGTTQRPYDFVVFDLETTGLRADVNEIIEIGAIKFDIDGPKEIFHTYVKPSKKITQKIQNINGITNEMVSNSPSIEEVLPHFVDFIGDHVLVAHNAEFDIGFILENLYKFRLKKIKNKVIDTLNLSRQKIREFDPYEDKNIKLSSYKLEELKEQFMLTELASHNSIDDCKVFAYVYLKIIAEDGDMCYV